MPPTSGGILCGANAAINLLVVCLCNLLAIAAAREEHHEICAACDVRGRVVHTEQFAKEIVELLFGFRLKELKHHVGACCWTISLVVPMFGTSLTISTSKSWGEGISLSSSQVRPASCVRGKRTFAPKRSLLILFTSILIHL